MPPNQSSIGTNTPVLRDYQREAVGSVMSDWGSGTKNTALVVPTGGGKTVMMAALVAAAVDLGLRVVLIAHRNELIDQIEATVARTLGGTVTVGVVNATRREYSAPVVVASVQTIMRGRHLERLGRRDVVLGDELHHYVSPRFLDTLGRLGVSHTDRDGVRHEGHAFFCGVTATLRREDGTRMADLVQKISYEVGLADLIDRGYLVRPRGLTVKIPGLELNRVRTVAGDFRQADLDKAIAAASSAIVHAIATHAADRRHIVFVPGVDSARDCAEKLTEAGVPAEAVTGDIPMADRRAIYDRYRSGELQTLVTVQVLTEGADFPMCDCVVMARPTKSKIVYSQGVGRSVRLYTDPRTGAEKTDALVLDITGVSRTMGLVNLTDLYGQAKRAKVTEDGDEEEMTADQIEAEQVAKMPPPPKAKREGPQEYVGIDLFSGGASSDWVWLETRSGVPFIASRERLVFLWEASPDTPAQDGTPGWLVGTRKIDRTAAGPEGWVTADHAEIYASDASAWDAFPDRMRPWARHTWPVDPANPGAPLSANRAYVRAEAVAASLSVTPVRHDDGWRRTSKPSSGQVGFGRQIGIPDPEMMTRARLSDELSVHVASNLLDHHHHVRNLQPSNQQPVHIDRSA